jgi:pyruvate dehydrogenase phosphatase
MFLTLFFFEGHYSSELAEFASTRIPRLVAEQFDPTARDADISQAISQIFQDFDSSLIEKVTKLFAPGEDWSDIHWTDRGNVHEVIGYGKQDPQFREGRLAVVGTTALIGIIDKQKRNIWVVSLGDSDAGGWDAAGIAGAEHDSMRTDAGREVGPDYHERPAQLPEC